MEKNNRDLTKVKSDVDSFFAEKKSKREDHLKEIAAKKGIPPEELRSEIAKKRADKLNKLAE